jgi:hypothetical protein
MQSKLQTLLILLQTVLNAEQLIQELMHQVVTYIYMAFAENPFVTSTGIPTTAR